MTPQLYREIMACFPTGVAIVTAHEAGGRPRGLTLSAFCAVSLDPQPGSVRVFANTLRQSLITKSDP